MLNNKTILITGGTGSFGQSFVEFVLAKFRPKKLIVFSRDELKQFRMQQAMPGHEKILRFFIGDIRDLARLERAFDGVDIVIHAAALKQVPALEYNPIEAIQTNIIGTQNVINAAINKGVKKAVLLSTDKCVQPINLYGATKLCAERLFISSNAYTKGGSSFSVVRYGNVMGSRGSIIETIISGGKKDPVYITHENMTRFWITLEQSFKLVFNALKNMAGGEIFVPKVPSMRLIDLCDALAPGRKRVFIGVRPGEKMHEALITTEEASRAFDMKDYFVILPNSLGSSPKDMRRFAKYRAGGRELPGDFCYTSDTNKEWLNHDSLRSSINKK